MALTDKNEPIDLELKVGQKERFRLNGDNKKVIELNVHDMDIVNRLDTAYPLILDEMSKIANLDTESKSFKDDLIACDAEIRKQIDYIFDSPVSDVIVSSGRMYDLYNGEFAYEHIIMTLSKLYEAEFKSEYKKLKSRIQTTASKYISKGKSRSKK